MMKTKLNWRLQDLPTAGEVAELVNSEVITKEEARDILFNDKTDNDNEEKKALKEQVEFLKGLVNTLSKNRGSVNTWNPYVYTFTTPATKWGWGSTIQCATGVSGGSSNLSGSNLVALGNGSTQITL